MTLLSAEESCSYHAFRFDEDRQAYLAAHLLLRHCLSRYLNQPARQIRFAVGPYGKPFLAGPDGDPPLEFNLTHTKGLAACAVTRRPVGVDAEWLGRRIGLDLAQSILTEEELRELNTQPLEQRPRRLLEYWTLKEAFVKGTGLGLHQPLQSFWFSLHPYHSPRINFINNQPPASRWRFLQFTTDNREHLVAVSVECQDGYRIVPSRFSLDIHDVVEWRPD